MFELPIPKRVSARPLVTVCGSFNKSLKEIRIAVEELFDYGAIVLSPRRPVTAAREIGPGFVLLDGDQKFGRTAIKAIEDNHLRCILRSDFVVLVCPGGYLGSATGGEMGVARAGGVPIYAVHPPIDDKLSRFVYVVPSLGLAVINHRKDLLSNEETA